jgi:hypothetical protein
MLYLYEYEILGGFFAPSKLFVSHRILTEAEVVQGINRVASSHKVVMTSVPFEFVLNGRKVRITCKEVPSADINSRKRQH